MEQWRDSLQDTLTNGKISGDRTGTGTIRQFGVFSRFDLKKGFPLEGSKFTSFDTIKKELCWMMSGDTNIRWLKANGVSIWDEWVDPATAEIRDMTAMEIVKASMKLENFDLDETLEITKQLLESKLGKTLVWSTTGGGGSEDSSIEMVYIGHSLTLDEKSNKKFLLEAIVHLVEDRHEEIGLTHEEFFAVTGLYNAIDYLPWRMKINQVLNRTTLWPFELVAGELGPIYNQQWVNATPKYHVYNVLSVIQEDILAGNLRTADEVFNATKKMFDEYKPINQLKIAEDCLKTNPESRRIMVNSWNVSELEEMKLPPCHYNFQFFSEELTVDERWELAEAFDENHYEDWQSECFEASQQGWNVDKEKFLDASNAPKRGLRILVNMRSNDAFLGEPFNIAQYALMVHEMAQVTGHYPMEVIMVRGDYHIYQNHVDQVEEVLALPDQSLPKLKLNKRIKSIFDFKPEDIEILNYKHGRYIPAPVAV